jgi:putative DNA primase/helicase
LERPEERQFKITDLKGYVTEHRRELVIAAITVLRAYVVAGSPDLRLLPWGGFDEWNATVRAPLVWLGMADPCATRQHVMEDDPDREQAAALITVWHSVIGSEAVQIADVIKRAASHPELTSVLLAAAAGKNDGARIDPRRVSWWCRDWRDRVVDGLSLIRGKDYGKSATWRVVQTADRGISGISGIKNPSTKTEGEGEGDLTSKGDDSHRGENNPTNPINPKNESAA